MPALTYARAHSLERCSSRQPGCRVQISIISTGLSGYPLGLLIPFSFQFIGQAIQYHPHTLPIIFELDGVVRLQIYSDDWIHGSESTVRSGTRSTNIKAYYTNKNRKVLLVSCDG